MAFKCHHVLLQLWKYPSRSLPALLIVVWYDASCESGALQWRCSMLTQLHLSAFSSLLIQCWFLSIWGCRAEAEHKQAADRCGPLAHLLEQFVQICHSATPCVKAYVLLYSLIKEAVFILLCRVLGLAECQVTPPLSFPPLSLHQSFIHHHLPPFDRGEHPGELHIGRMWGREGGPEWEESVFQRDGRRAGGLWTWHNKQQRLIQVKVK